MALPGRGRLAAAWLAAAAVGLGFAAPAYADGGTDIQPPTPPAPTDTSQTAATAAAAVVTQVAPSNVDVSVRIASPGDAGAVVQTITAAAAAAASAAQPADVQPGASAAAVAQAGAAQSAPSNLNVSVRIGSPGDDAAVTQTITSSAAQGSSAGQYQAAPSQYQPAPNAPASTASAAPSPATPAPSEASQTPAVGAVSSNPPAAPSGLPVTWTWNWNWTCGDTAGAGTTSTIDTGIPAWVWTLTLQGACPVSGLSSSNMTPVIPPESGGSISAPVPPTPPTLPQVELPTPPSLPQVVSPTPPALAPLLEVPAIAPASFLPTIVPVAPQLVLVPSAVVGDPSSRPLAAGRAPTLPPPPASGFAGAASVEDSSPTAGDSHRTAESRRAGAPTQLGLPRAALGLAGETPAAGGGGASGGGAVAIALGALWLLGAYPGLSTFRRPRSLRVPRTRSDDTLGRPG